MRSFLVLALVVASCGGTGSRVDSVSCTFDNGELTPVVVENTPVDVGFRCSLNGAIWIGEPPQRVTIEVGALPTGVRASFNPAELSIKGSDKATGVLTLTRDGSAMKGSYEVPARFSYSPEIKSEYRVKIDVR